MCFFRRIDSGVESLNRLTAEKNTNLFSSMNVMSEEECNARAAVNLDHYTGFVELEALSLIDMIKQHMIPAAKKSAPQHVDALAAGAATLQAKLDDVHAAAEDSELAAATLARELRLETMEEVRPVCDAAEADVAAEDWTLATYQELMFLDQTQVRRVPLLSLASPVALNSSSFGKDAFGQ